MTNFFRAIGRFTIGFIRGLGATVLFLLNILLRSTDSIKRPRLTIRQLYFSGVMSILIVAVSGLFMGMVLGLQVYNILVQFKAADVLGFAVAASLLREIGPVLAALLFASSAGSAMTSEIGLMKTTEQLEAMNVMAVNPVARVVAPRFWAGVISMPLLAAICDVFQCAVFAGRLAAVGGIRLLPGTNKLNLVTCRVDHSGAETTVILHVFLAWEQRCRFLGKFNAASDRNYINIIRLTMQQQVTDIAAHDVRIVTQFARRGGYHLEKTVI